METFLNSILVKRIVFESNYEGILMNCEVFDSGRKYNSDFVLSSNSFNRFLNECSARGISFDFETNLVEHSINDGNTISILDINTEENLVFLPSYCLPKTRYQMRA